MPLHEMVHSYIDALKPIDITDEWLMRLTRLIDLTSLNEIDTETSITAFCEKVTTRFGHVAAVCVYPRFVRLLKTIIREPAIKIATVINFPEGAASLEATLIEINRALSDGAQEIDVVFPYLRYLAGDKKFAYQFVENCKAACGDAVLLKVILETGALNDLVVIEEASRDALTAGADFIKTSTGKITQGATCEAVATMLCVIRDKLSEGKSVAGIKISGGIRHLSQAVQYLELTESIMGRAWITSQTCRIGASKLMDEIINRSL